MERRGTSPPPQGRSGLSDPAVRGLWLAIATLAAVLVGAAGGLLGWAAGMNPFAAVLTAGSAFAGALLTILTALRFTATPID